MRTTAIAIVVALAFVVMGCSWWPFGQPAGVIKPIVGLPSVSASFFRNRSTVIDGIGRDAAVFFFMTPFLTGFEASDGYDDGEFWFVNDGLPIDESIKVTVSLQDSLVIFTAVPEDPADHSLLVRVEYDEPHSKFSIEQHYFFEDPTGELGQGASKGFIFFRGQNIPVSKEGDEYVYNGLVDVGVFFYGTDSEIPSQSAMQLRQHEMYRGRLDGLNYGLISFLGDTQHITNNAEFPDPLGGFVPSGVPDVSLFTQYGEYFSAYTYVSRSLAPFAYYCIDGAQPVALEPLANPELNELTEAEKWEWFHAHLPPALDTRDLILDFE